MSVLKKVRWYHPVFILFTLVSVYLLMDYQPLDETKLYLQSSGQVNVENTSVISFIPQSPNGVGLIFYPGGKVAPEAYAPLLYKLAHEGYSCFIIKMPYNLAVFNINGADAVIKSHGDLQEWYIGGHSLGGVMATEYAVQHLDQVKGIYYLASYPAKDLSQMNGLRTLSIYASKDAFVTTEKQTQYNPLLPSQSQIATIIGGNHSQFGYYGHQQGDGTAEISLENQQSQLMELLSDWLSEVD